MVLIAYNNVIKVITKDKFNKYLHVYNGAHLQG
jgi:hypothetical protein